jgi:hypothetical protein
MKEWVAVFIKVLLQIQILEFPREQRLYFLLFLAAFERTEVRLLIVFAVFYDA